MSPNATIQLGFRSHGDDMSERLERVLQHLKSARPIAEKSPTLGKVVELIDEAIIEAESKLKATRSNDGRKQ